MFGRKLKKSHLLSSPYTIPLPKRQKAHNVEDLLATEVINVDDAVLVDLDPLKGLENPILFSEFEQWYHDEITMNRPIMFMKVFLR